MKKNRHNGQTGLGTLVVVLLTSVLFAEPQSETLPSEPQQAPSAGIEQAEPDQVRDPFWPIGYRARHEKRIVDTMAQGSAEDWLKAMAKLRIGAITKAGNRHLVLINGNTCKQDDVLGVEHDGRIYRFKIKAVHIDRVELRKLEVRKKPPKE